MSTKNIYSIILNIEDITNICTVFNQKPFEKYSSEESFLYLSKVSDNNTYASNKGFIQKTARISFTIFSKSNLMDSEDHQEILENIISNITNSIVNQDCLPIKDWDGINVCDIIEDSESPILYGVKGRPYIVKDYLFVYQSQNG